MFDIYKHNNQTVYSLDLFEKVYIDFTVRTWIYGVKNTLKNKIFNKLYMFHFQTHTETLHDVEFDIRTTAAGFFIAVGIITLLMII